MPEYTFICEDCGAKFSDIYSFRAYDEAVENKTIRCCSCNKTNIGRCYEDDCINIAGSIKKSDSELKTLGDLANRNRDRMSEDHKEYLHRKHNDYKLDKPNDPLPASPAK